MNLYKTLVLSLLSIAFLLITINFTFSEEVNPALEFSNIPADLKINEIQVLGTHNSYAQPVDSHVIAHAAPIVNKMMEYFMSSKTEEELAGFKENHPNNMDFANGLRYNHPPFPDQLDAGLRNLEIDVYYDPDGGRFSNPAAYRVLQEEGVENLAPHNTKGLETPGFKVLHMADYDFRSHYPTFKDALEALKKWSDENEGHIPIYIQLEAKDMGIPIFPNPTKVEQFDATAYEKLDAEIFEILGRDNVITPDDVRGEYKTLREAVLANNWPTVNSSRGKFIFLLLPSAAGLKHGSPYTETCPNLEGRAMFAQSQPTDDYAAFFLLDNAVVRYDEIQEYVKQGFMVRSRSDIETYEAMVNDYTRAKAAFSSGAQVVSTDFYKPGNYYGTDYYVKLPGGDVARCNPVNGITKCTSGAQ